MRKGKNERESHGMNGLDEELYVLARLGGFFCNFGTPLFSMCRAFPQCGDISGATLGVPSEALLHLRNYYKAMPGIGKFLRGKITLRVFFFSD